MILHEVVRGAAVLWREREKAWLLQPLCTSDDSNITTGITTVRVIVVILIAVLFADKSNTAIWGHPNARFRPSIGH
jgi:hypothetical protein